MFGHQDDKDTEETKVTPSDVTPPSDDITTTHSDAPIGVTDSENNNIPSMPVDPVPSEPTSAPPTDNTIMPSALPDDDSADSTVSTVEPTNDVTEAPDSNASTADLIDIKQQALKQLSPLVNHLEQTPEEKFRTIMMMIQAADDQSLIKDAYEAAQNIADEKVKAQALLDIVNEINYFSHPHDTN